MAYKSKPLPISFTHEQYTADRDVIYIIDRNKEYMELDKVIDFVASDNVKTKSLPGYEERICYVPGKKFVMPVDTAKVIAQNVVSEEYRDQIASEMRITCNKSAMLKNELMVLDMKKAKTEPCEPVD